MAAGSIVIDLLMKTGSFETDTARAGKSLKQFQKEADATAKALGLAFGLSVTGAAAALGLLVKNSIDSADHLNDLSKKTGIAVDTLGGIGFAASQAGGDLETASAAAGKLNKSLAEAAAGNEEAGQAFKALGIDVKDAAGNTKTADAAMVEIADKFAKFNDGPEKAALALRLFGKAGADMIPILDDGGRALQENIDYYKRFSGVTQETAEAADRFNDTLGKISLLSGALGRTLAAELLSPMQEIANEFLRMKENGSGFESIAGGLRNVLEALAVTGANVAFVFAGVGRSIGAFIAGIAAIAEGNFEGAHQIRVQLKLDDEQARKDLDNFERRVLYRKENFPQASYSNEGRNATPGKTNAPRLPGGGPAAVASEYDRLIRSITEKIATDDAELASTTKLTEGQKLQAKVFADIDAGYLKLTLAQKLAVDGKLQELLASEKLLKVRDDELKYLKEAGDENVRYIETQQELVKTLRDQTKNAELQLAEFGLTRDEIEKLATTRLRDAAAALEQKAAQADSAYLDDNAKLYREQAAAIRATADARDELAAKISLQQNDPLTGLHDAVKDYLRDVSRAGDATYKAVSNSIRSLEDFGVAALTGGNLKDAARSLVNQLIAEFARLQVIRPLLASLGSSGGLQGLLSGLSNGGYNLSGTGSGAAPGYTGATSFAVGTDRVPSDGLYQLHKDEAVVPKAFNPALHGGSGGDVYITNNSPAQVSAQKDDSGDWRILVEQAADIAHNRVAADIGSGAGRVSSSLKSRGVSLAGGMTRRR